jgi:hypothetical protein
LVIQELETALKAESEESKRKLCMAGELDEFEDEDDERFFQEYRLVAQVVVPRLCFADSFSQSEKN